MYMNRNLHMESMIKIIRITNPYKDCLTYRLRSRLKYRLAAVPNKNIRSEAS